MTGEGAHRLVWRRPDSPVLHNPVLLPPAVHAIAHQQHGVVDVFRVTVGVIVNTWGGEESQHLCGAFRDPSALFILPVKPLFNQQPPNESLSH